MNVPSGYRRAVLLTKSDTINHLPNTGNGPPVADALWVGGAGVCACVQEDGVVVNVTCVAGSLLPLRTIRLNSTDTTATVVAALFR